MFSGSAPGKFEAVSDTTLSSFASIHRPLGGDFVRSAFSKEPPLTSVSAFGVFPYDYKLVAVGENKRSKVDIKVKFKPGFKK